MQLYGQVGTICLNILLLIGHTDGCKRSNSYAALTFLLSFAAWFLFSVAFSAVYLALRRNCYVRAQLLGPLLFTCLRVTFSELVQLLAESENRRNKNKWNNCAFFAGEIASSFVLSWVLVSTTPTAAKASTMQYGLNENFLVAVVLTVFCGRLILFHIVLAAQESMRSRLVLRMAIDVLAYVGPWLVSRA